MKPPEGEVRRLVVEWIRKADLDVAAAERLARDEEQFRDIVAFHCQQAVEKYMKALLVHHQVEFPKTHDIERLLRLIALREPTIGDAMVEAKWLTPFGVNIRYPGDLPDTVPGDQTRALEIAHRVRVAVRAALSKPEDSDPKEKGSK